MDSIAPIVTKGLHLLGLAGVVVGLAVLHVSAGGGLLEVAIELDALGQVQSNVLHTPRGPSRSARLAMVWREPPRIMRLDQFWS